MALAGFLLPLLAAGLIQAGDDAPPQDVEGCWAASAEVREGRTPREERPLVFIGSSSIARWGNLAGDTASLPIQCGYWGKQTADMIAHAEPVAALYKPRRIFYYAGDNDLDDDHGRRLPSNTPEGVRDNFQRFVEKVRTVPGMAETPITFLSIKECADRWHLIDKIRETNLAVCRLAEKDPNLDFIDVFDALLSDDHSAPNAELFERDGLHLNDAGYRKWGAIIRRWKGPDQRFVSAHGCSWLEYVVGKASSVK